MSEHRPPERRDRLALAPQLSHPRIVAGVATLGLAASYALARQDPVPAFELDLTSWINGAPAWGADALWPVMQLGSAWGPLIVAGGILAVHRDRLLASATLVTGLATWFAAKGVKELVGRGRPPAYIADIVVHEGKGTGLGFISGHSAVAASTAVMVMAALPRRARPFAAIVAAAIGIARIVYGVHLPADVVGGWSFGALTGLAGLTVVDRLRRRTAARSAGATR